MRRCWRSWWRRQCLDYLVTNQVKAFFVVLVLFPVRVVIVGTIVIVGSMMPPVPITLLTV